jgi:hypothetical protein
MLMIIVSGFWYLLKNRFIEKSHHHSMALSCKTAKPISLWLQEHCQLYSTTVISTAGNFFFGEQVKEQKKFFFH